MPVSVYRPYIKDAQKILTRAREYGNPRIAQSKMNFLHLAIIDGSITTDSAISRLADDCCDRVRSGEKLYIHCWGGHGRTGTLVSKLVATTAFQGILHVPTVGARLSCTIGVRAFSLIMTEPLCESLAISAYIDQA